MCTTDEGLFPEDNNTGGVGNGGTPNVNTGNDGGNNGGDNNDDEGDDKPRPKPLIGSVGI